MKHSRVYCYVSVTISEDEPEKLPVIAEIWFSGPDYYDGEYDCGCDGLFCIKPDGTRGDELPLPIMKIIEKDSYWEGFVAEQCQDWLANNCFENGHSEEYFRINPKGI